MEFVLDYVECPGVSKDKNKWFWEPWVDTSDNPQLMNMLIFRLSNNEIEKLLIENEAE